MSPVDVVDDFYKFVWKVALCLLHAILSGRFDIGDSSGRALFFVVYDFYSFSIKRGLERYAETGAGIYSYNLGGVD